MWSPRNENTAFDNPEQGLSIAHFVMNALMPNHWSHSLDTYTSLRHQADTHYRSPSPRPPTLHHSRCAPPPLPTFYFACPPKTMQRPASMPPVCLGACIVTINEASVFEKVPSRPWNHRSPRGAFTLLGPDSIYQISL